MRPCVPGETVAPAVCGWQIQPDESWNTAALAIVLNPSSHTEKKLTPPDVLGTADPVLNSTQAV